MTTATKYYSSNDLGNAIEANWHYKVALRNSTNLQKHFTGTDKNGNAKQYTWNDINTFLTERGWAPKQIVRIMSALKYV